MAIYYRADTRSPEEIFEKGFSPRNEKGEKWWIDALQLEKAGKVGIDKKASDAVSENTVCMTTKFESAALFPYDNDKSVGEHLYIYAITLPDPMPVAFDKKERDIYLRNKLPNEAEIEKYKDSYVVVYSPRSLNYITPEGKIEKLKTPVSEFSLDDNLASQLNFNNIIKLSVKAPGFTSSTPLKKVLNEEQLSAVWRDIAASNPLHKQKNNAVLIANEDSPTDNMQMVIDLHQMQSAQAGHIVNKENKAGLFSHHTSLHAAWPLLAYEAIAHDVPPQNIVCAVKVHREEIKIGEAIEKSASHPNAETIPMSREFTVEGNVRMNENFKAQQELTVGRNGNPRVIQVDYTNDAVAVSARLENAVKSGKLETPDIHYGLGGKTY